LQSPPTGGRLNDEGCVGSHGCILSLVDGSLVSEPGYTLSPFYTRFLTPPVQRPTQLCLDSKNGRGKM
ncbi:MAG: hypothetical protein KGJ88_13365, partial [Verrucomicrobiota bacterium]|nr:hypothetical protein [Verrucomicrobiota bacterium]